MTKKIFFLIFFSKCIFAESIIIPPEPTIKDPPKDYFDSSKKKGLEETKKAPVILWHGNSLSSNPKRLWGQWNLIFPKLFFKENRSSYESYVNQSLKMHYTFHSWTLGVKTTFLQGFGMQNQTPGVFAFTYMGPEWGYLYEVFGGVLGWTMGLGPASRWGVNYGDNLQTDFARSPLLSRQGAGWAEIFWTKAPEKVSGSSWQLGLGFHKGGPHGFLCFSLGWHFWGDSDAVLNHGSLVGFS